MIGLFQICYGFSSLAGLVTDDAALKGRKVPFDSGRDRGGEHRKRWRLTGALVLCLLSVMPIGVSRAAEPEFDIDIPAMNAAEALNRLAEQTGSVMLFSYDLALAREANAVRGRYTLLVGLELLLRDTGLSGGVSDKRVVVIAEVGNMPAGKGETVKKRGMWASVIAVLAASTATEVTADQESGAAKLEEIVVTAQKREELLQDVPISISVLSGVELDSSTAEGMTELLNRVPGVATVLGAQGGSTQITVRGVSAGDAIFNGSSPVAYYLDSIPFGFVKSAIAPDLNPYDLAQVEVLRGPQGTLYGASALNGVVRILTNDADPAGFDIKARALLSSTDDRGGDNYRGDLAVNVPLVAGTLAVRGVVGYEDLSGWIDSPVSDRERVNDAELRNYRLKVNAQPSDEFSIGLSAWSSIADYGGKSTAADDATITATFPEPISIDFDTYGLKIDYEFPAFLLSSRTSYLDYSNASILDVGPLGFAAEFQTDFESKVIAEEVLLSSQMASPWQWSMGAFYRDGEDVLFQTFPGFPGAFYADYTDRSESFALFGEVSRKFYNDRLKWTLGLRYFEDDVLNKENSSDPSLPARLLERNSASFDSTTPRAVLSWYPHDDLTVYGSYSEGFRSGFPQNANILQQAPGFPPMRPDKLRNYEVGAKGSLIDGRLSYDAALYFIDWQDIQQTLAVDFNGVPISAPVNGESASGVGFDFGLTTEPVDGLGLGINFSWNDLSLDAPTLSGGGILFEEGERPNLSPELTAGASLDYEVSLGGGGLRGRFSASANYTSEQITRVIDTSTVPPSRIVATGDEMLIARTSLSLESPRGWTITLFADNINNEQGTPVITVLAVPELNLRVRPRTIGLQFDYQVGR